jgi:hypothetical protein
MSCISQHRLNRVEFEVESPLQVYEGGVICTEAGVPPVIVEVRSSKS